MKQGDPLSPYLYVHVADRLNKILVKARETSLIKGLQMESSDVGVLNLHYANYTLLFCQADK